MPSRLHWLREVIALVADIGGVIALIVLVGSAVGWLIRRLRRGAIADSAVPYLIALGIIGACGSLAAGLARLWLGQEDLLAVILVAAGAAGALAGCAYIRFLKIKTGEILGYIGNRPWEITRPAYSEWQRLVAFIGLILIPMLTVGGLAGWWYVRGLPPQKAIILVANFYREGMDKDDYQFTGLLLERLRNALAGDAKVEVQSLKRAITTQEGSPAARQEGERRKAAIVIWGWYGVPPGATTAVVSTHFEVLREPKYMPTLGAEEPRLVALAHLESFAFQTQLSREMTYLAAFAVGMGHYAADELEGAIRSFTTALAQTAEPVQTLNQGVIYFYRGTAYSLRADYERAITDYNQTITFTPNNAVAYYNRGNTYAYLGQYERAIADYGQAIALQPDYAAAHINRGNIYDDLGQYEQAIADYNQAIAFQPGYADAYANRGVAYARHSEYEQAIADYNRAITLQPNYAEAYYNRGVAYTDLGQYQQAIADYDQAIALKPDDIKAYLNRGGAYAKQGQYQRAIADCNRAIALQPDYAEAYYDRGAAYANLGQHQRAITDYDQAIALKPDLVVAYMARGLSYETIGEKAKAAADFHKVLELSKDAKLRGLAEKELARLE